LPRPGLPAGELGYTKQPYVVIIGGGQGGIGLVARLRQLGVPTIIVEPPAPVIAGPRSVTEIAPDGVILDGGTKLAADLIGQDVADKVGKCWGLGSDTTKDPGPWEGEQRNMWKPTRQEALWFHGGNLHQSRHYSQFLSLQLKARLEGLETPVYGIPRVSHLG